MIHFANLLVLPARRHTGQRLAPDNFEHQTSDALDKLLLVHTAVEEARHETLGEVLLSGRRGPQAVQLGTLGESLQEFPASVMGPGAREEESRTLSVSACAASRWLQRALSSPTSTKSVAVSVRNASRFGRRASFFSGAATHGVSAGRPCERWKVGARTGDVDV